MFGSIYTALAGMNAYSQGLSIVSNNVANLNTPGFKVSDPLFREIVYRQIQASEGNGGGLRPQGAGVEAGAAGINFSQGDPRDTGNSMDAAIDGSGFFVLELEDGAYRYTRAGQFTFNDDGVLVERTTGAKVVFSAADGASGSFDLNAHRADPPKATTTVALAGTLARTGTSTSGAVHEVPSITVFDPNGTAMSLRARFTRNSADALRWNVEIIGAANAVLGSATVAFNDDGTPAQDNNSFSVSVPGSGGANFDITFNVGEPNRYAGVTSPGAGTTSSVQLLRQDGLALGSLTRTAFDEQGQLKLTYSNGQTRAAGKLVLANFDNPDQLQTLGSGMFALKSGEQVRFGTALADGVGRIVGQRVEMSNVDLTRQFTDLIILQRGYQASSQVSSIANELIQTLLAMDAQR